MLLYRFERTQNETTLSSRGEEELAGGSISLRVSREDASLFEGRRDAKHEEDEEGS